MQARVNTPITERTSVDQIRNFFIWSRNDIICYTYNLSKIAFIDIQRHNLWFPFLYIITLYLSLRSLLGIEWEVIRLVSEVFKCYDPLRRERGKRETRSPHLKILDRKTEKLVILPLWYDENLIFRGHSFGTLSKTKLSTNLSLAKTIHSKI